MLGTDRQVFALGGLWGAGRLWRSWSVGALLFAFVSLAAGAQEVEDPGLLEEIGVTSIDLWVGAPGGKLHEWWAGDRQVLRGVRLENLELVVPGAEVEIRALEGRRLEPGSTAPWQILIYFDAPLCDELGLRWAAGALSEQAWVLASRGSVQVVVANPQPRVFFGPSSDGDRLQEVLSNLALFGEAGDSVRSHREAFLSEIEESDAEERLELAKLYAPFEVELLLSRQDTLLEWLVRNARPEARKLLVYVSHGFERQTGRFYGLPDDNELGPLLERESSDWAIAVASYDWATVTMLPLERRAPLLSGLTLGKFRFAGLIITYERDRDPELAEAFIELGDVSLGGSDLSGAEDAYRRAIYHFYYHKKTRERQAVVYLKLADVLRKRNKPGSARMALFHAMAVDERLRPTVSSSLGSLFEPESVLEELASETGGVLIRRSRNLGEAFADLDRRRRLSFQLSGLPTGEVLPLELLSDDGGAVFLHRKWVRSGTPRRVAVARLRQFLRESEDEPDLQRGWIARLDSRALSLSETDHIEPRRRRMLLGYSNDRALLQVLALEPGALQPTGLRQWTAELLEDSSADLMAVYSEDLTSGEWTVGRLELE